MIMATLLPEGKQSFTDSAGAPLAGGKLYTYDAGTSNPRATYQDAAGTTPNTNPIVLDARGEAIVFGSGTYKVILNTSADVTLWTVDNIADIQTIANGSIGQIQFNPVGIYSAGSLGKWLVDLATSTGASFIGWIQVGAGAVTRLVQDKLRERLTAADFGANSTGVAPADDITAINKAIAATPIRSTVELGQSRISLSPAKPGFDSNLAAFQSVTWKQNITVKAKGPTQEEIYVMDNVAANGTPVNEVNIVAPYHPGLVLDCRSPASYNGIAQPTHIQGAVIGSTTQNATSLVYRRDNGSEYTMGVRSSIPSTASTTGSISGVNLTVASGTGIATGQTVYTGGAANGVIQGTKVTGGAGTAWTVDISQNAANQPLILGVDNRRLNEFAEVGTTKGVRVLDLATGFQAWGNERTAMVVPHEFGGQIDISVGSNLKPYMSGFNTDPYLRLNDNNSYIGGLKISHASQLLAFVVENSVADGTSWLQLAKNGGFIDASSSFFSPNSNNTILRLGKNGTTSRSINAAGTVNASGADYAEYERNNGLTIQKGDIVGFKEDGTLTNVYAEAIRFGIKSTNPSYVGGDDWFTDERPQPPAFDAPLYAGIEEPNLPLPDASEEEVYAHRLALLDHNVAIQAWKASCDVALGIYENATLPAYETALKAFHNKLDCARSKVDRVAYSGKVPVNVQGAVPGQYIIAAESVDGGIVGSPIASPSFEQYRMAVGRVNRILDDGRAEVAVIIH
jgi:hypothetical protein